MTGIEGVLILSLAGLAVGAALFLLVRRVFMRGGATHSISPKATLSDYLQVAAMTSALLLLAWKMESGVTAAAALFAVIVVAAKAWRVFLARKAANLHEESE